MTREDIDEYERARPGSWKLKEICDLARLGLTAQELAMRHINKPSRPGDSLRRAAENANRPIRLRDK